MTEWDYKVNRLEVIDHSQDGEGRAFSKRAVGDFTVTMSHQDGGRTLKIFLGVDDEGGSKVEQEYDAGGGGHNAKVLAEGIAHVIRP